MTDQQLLDFERGERTEAAVKRQLEGAGLPPAAVQVAWAILEGGELIRRPPDEDGGGAIHWRVWRGSVRSLATAAGRSVSTTSKGLTQLEGLGVLTRTAGAAAVDVPALFDCQATTDPVTKLLAAAKPARPAAERTPPVRTVFAPAPIPITKRDACAPPIPNALATTAASSALDDRPTDRATGEPGHIGGVLARLAAVDDRLNTKAAQISDKLQRVLEAAEELHGVAAEDRLMQHTADQIAAAAVAAEDGEAQLEYVLRSIARKREFCRSPAAYLVTCAKRRQWI